MRCPRVAVLAVLLLSVAAVAPGGAGAAVLNVTDCGDTTPGGAPGQLRRLITDAADGDTILIPACIITLTGAANEDLNAGGDLDIAKSLTIRGAGSHATVIDGGQVDRVIDILVWPPPPAPLIDVNISDLMIRNGFGFTRGGGIRNGSNLSLSRVVVRSNRVTGTFEAGGAGIANHGSVNAVDITVDGNFGSGPVLQSGGGIHNVGGFTLERSTVSHNGVEASEFFSNSGGIANSGTLIVRDSTISGNDGGDDGPGGIFNTGTLTLVHTAVVNNGSLAGDNGLRNAGVATVTNSILANNGGIQCSGVIGSGDGNLVTDATCGLGGGNDAVNPAPGLGPLSTHGGATNTHALLPGSPAIDTAPAPACTPTDQRGVIRPQDGDGDTVAACDKGPFEFFAPIFADVPAEHIARGAIEALRVNGITNGCGAAPLVFCPNDPVTRAELAVFLLRALEGAGFIPPPAVGLFADLPAGNVFAPFVEELFNRGITKGCGPSLYCPDDPVTRTQLSVLILRSLAVPGFVPPPATGLFADVPAGNPNAPFIEEFFRRGVTSGCQANPAAFCPADAATRAQIAIFLVRSFGFGF